MELAVELLMACAVVGFLYWLGCRLVADPLEQANRSLFVSAHEEIGRRK